MIEIIKRNLRPELRFELLYVNIISIAHLKHLVQLRENLLTEDSFRQYVSMRNPVQRRNRRNVAAIQVETSENFPEENEITGAEISALHQQRKLVCWNYDHEGHVWDMCLRERKLFCYGCGLKNAYKPQCPSCNVSKSENLKKGSFENSRVVRN